MSSKSTRLLGRSVYLCPFFLLACSATGNQSHGITDQDVLGGASGAATSMAGSSGLGGATGSGATGIGATGAMEAPGATSPPPIITPLPGAPMDPGKCSVDQNILFLIDRSGSMQCNPPPTTDSATCEFFPRTADTTMPTKLQIVETALSTAFDQLLPTMAGQPATRAGMAVLSTDDVCGTTTMPLVPVTDVSQPFLDQMRMAMNGLVPNGTTPIVNAVTSAYQYFQMNAAALPGNKHVILVTDGADTCTNQSGIQNLIDTVAPQALSMGVNTWVIGAPGSEGARSMLSHLAKAGGTARANCDVGTTPTTGNCHFDMTQGDFATSFKMALATILSAVECGIR
ncbi:MAG TPA: vWA domain-containing protein [Polyangiaceae bacterium]|jgi:hypothetical protein|nr:vWA domain-containing protein [Polyangiaceae bacterium]